MPWATLVRVLEIVRWPLSVGGAVGCSVALTLEPYLGPQPAPFFAFVMWFVLALLVAVFVLTALLALVEQAADDAARAIRVPTAVASYRTACPREDLP